MKSRSYFKRVLIFSKIHCVSAFIHHLSQTFNPIVHEGGRGNKELRSQLSQEQSGSNSPTFAHRPLTALTRNSSEASAGSKSDPSPSVPESSMIKRGDYPLRHGPFDVFP